jgi:hypothetical protein
MTPALAAALNLLLRKREKRPMNLQQLALMSVIDESRFFEPLHEEAHPRPRRPYHFRQRFMTDLRNLCGRSATIKTG